MKKIVCFIFTLLFMFVFTACTSSEAEVILDNGEKTRFIDFYTEGDYVYIECELNIFSDRDATVSISSVDVDDVKTGLLKDEKLTGINKSDGSTEFKLKDGENTVQVLFRGYYAGVPEISQREVPRFITIENVKR